MIYTESGTIQSNAESCAPPPLPRKTKTSIYSQQERTSDRLGNAAPAWWSHARACTEYMEDSLFSWVGVGGQQPLMGCRVGHSHLHQIIYILCISFTFYPTIFLVAFMPSPAIEAKNVGVGGFHKTYIYVFQMAMN